VELSPSSHPGSSLQWRAGSWNVPAQWIIKFPSLNSKRSKISHLGAPLIHKNEHRSVAKIFV
jgi:hypothetical protein